ncbi:MAG: HPF/RaiA family ribosome-associated protein, partial [Gammaproteobacteria bacterium]|nr:HPF/RaiA family ribosome-associated protein [Gammaproteobacteria bacterium]
ETIKNKVHKLDRFYDRIISCRVTVDTPHRHKHQGKEFNVSIDIVVPGNDIFVKNENHEDLYIAIRDAFESARRQLQIINQKQKGKKPKMVSRLAKQSVEQEIENEFNTVLGLNSEEAFA